MSENFSIIAQIFQKLSQKNRRETPPPPPLPCKIGLNKIGPEKILSYNKQAPIASSVSPELTRVKNGIFLMNFNVQKS